MYCRQCHKQKGPDHFDLYPDHANTGPKVSLARRRELLRQEGEGAPRTSRGEPIREPIRADIEGDSSERVPAGVWFTLAGIAFTLGAGIILPAWRVMRQQV